MGRGVGCARSPGHVPENRHEVAASRPNMTYSLARQLIGIVGLVRPDKTLAVVHDQDQPSEIIPAYNVKLDADEWYKVVRWDQMAREWGRRVPSHRP